jgi:hypothetical protein
VAIVGVLGRAIDDHDWGGGHLMRIADRMRRFSRTRRTPQTA